MKKEIIKESLTLGKFVHGGQCIAQTEEGKKLFVWGGLPGEVVDVRITKKKSSYLEGIVTKVHTPSKDRIEPKEPLSYLSTSPWQIVTYDAENSAKQSILDDSFAREGMSETSWQPFVSSKEQYHYRNKMEFGFWGDDGGLHMAHYVRGSSGKQIIEGSILAKEAINDSARAVSAELERIGVWGGKLKTLLVRASQSGETVATLFMKEEIDVSKFEMPDCINGIDFFLSDPKSPASVATKKLVSVGDIRLSDTILGQNINYDVRSFFQVNLPIFEQALTVIKDQIGDLESVDMYSGVGTIGIAVGSEILVESDNVNIKMMKKNVQSAEGSHKVVHASSESATEYISPDKALIVDPPRAGLHSRMIDAILDVLPPKILYLSCNPSTQARDVKYLLEQYKITYAQGYNFFPRTPHIESLIVLEPKSEEKHD